MIDYGRMKNNEAVEVLNFILRIFHKDVAPTYSTEGIKKFLSMLSASELCEMNSQDGSFIILAKNHNIPIGMLGLKNENHIALLFVEKEYQSQGVGSELVNRASKICLARKPELKSLTVSSSPNSTDFYKKIGFEAQGEEVNEEGMRFTPMRKPI